MGYQQFGGDHLDTTQPIDQDPIANTTIGYGQSLSTITYFNGSTDYVEVTAYTGNTTSQTINANANLTILDTITVNQTVSTKMLVSANSYIKQGQMFTGSGESLQDSTSTFAQFIRSL